MSAFDIIEERNREQMKLVNILNQIEIDCMGKHCLVTIIKALLNKRHEGDKQKAFDCIVCLFDEFLKSGPLFELVLEAKATGARIPDLWVRKTGDWSEWYVEVYGDGEYDL